MCVVKQLGINLRITVQLILNAEDGVGALMQRRGKDIQTEVTEQRLCVPAPDRTCCV